MAATVHHRLPAWPFFAIGGSSQPSASNFTLNSATVQKSMAWIFPAESSDAQTHGGIRQGTVTGTAPTYRLSLQGVNASGEPDGTVLGGGSPASVTFQPVAGGNSTFQWKQFDNSYTPTRGQLLALVLEYNSGTIDASNNCSFASTLQNNVGFGNPGLPFALTNTSSVWTKNTSLPLFGWRTATSRGGLIFQTNYQVNTAGTAGHRQAGRLTVPSGSGTSVQCVGVQLACRIPASAATFKVALWDATTELAAVTLDVAQLNGNGVDRSLSVYFTTPQTLSVGTTYYFGVEVIGTAAVGVRGINLSHADDRLAYPFGTNRGFSSWNGSAWADADTILALVEPLFEDVTASGGGGGGPLINHGRLVL